MNSKIVSIIVGLAMAFSGLITFSISTQNAVASSTGDVYSGSGDWVITNPTTYTDEVLTVYGNITINDGGSLHLINSALTLSQNSSMYRKIHVNYASGTAPYLELDSASVIQTTNYTVGKYNAELKVSGLGYLLVDNSVLQNLWLNLVSGPGSHVQNSTLIGTTVWTNFAFGYESADPVVSGPYVFSDTVFRDTNTTDQTYVNLMTLGCQVTINNCAFSNITLPSGTPDASAVVRAVYQHNLTIVENDFNDTIYPSIYLRGSDTYPVADCIVSNNEYDGVGSDLAHYTYSNWLRGTALRTEFSDNYFGVVRNGSYGILITGAGWELNDNVFNNIDATDLIDTGKSLAIKIEPPGGVVIDGTVINNVVGPGTDLGANAVGILAQNAGNFTISHSVMRNVSYSGGAIAAVDSVGYNGLGNITIHANTVQNVNNLATAVYFFGGTGGAITWNNVSHVGGSCAGIMIHDTHQLVTISNNSVTDLFYEPNEWPLWQISVGAYSVCAGTVWNVTFADNHASGATAIHPTYDINGELLGEAGWSGHMESSIDVSEDAIIRQTNSNITLVHDGGIIGIELDDTATSMSYYSNGTSWKYIPKVDLAQHWINITALPMSLTTTDAVDITIDSFDMSLTEYGQTPITWTAESAAPDIEVTYTFSGLESGTMFRVTQDGNSIGTGVGPSFSLTATGTSEFELVVAYGQQVSRLVQLTVNMLALGLLIGVVGNSIRPLKDPKNRNPEKFGKVVLNTVICIVVGIILITVVNNMFLG